MNSPISKCKLSGRSRRYLQADLILPELAMFITLVVATLMITWSVILSIGNSILGGYGDNIYFLWEMWWFKRALLDLHVSPFVDNELYYPVGLELARDEITPANTIIGLPLTASFGPTAAYNILVQRV